MVCGEKHHTLTTSDIRAGLIKKNPLTVLKQRALVAEMVENIGEAAKIMREQVSRPAKAQDGKPPEDDPGHRQEQRAAAGTLAKLMMGMDKGLERYRILSGKSLPPNLHTEPIPRKPVAHAKPKNKPPPLLGADPMPQDRAA